MSEGFWQAGFDVAGQIEMDKWACETLRLRNFYHELTKINKNYHYKKFIKGQILSDDLAMTFPEINKVISNVVIQAEFGKTSLKHIS
ncbi:MAG: DNA (cytosine-5-)-methyltransferase, partial [Nitrososphaerales archaeon]